MPTDSQKAKSISKSTSQRAKCYFLLCFLPLYSITNLKDVLWSNKKFCLMLHHLVDTERGEMTTRSSWHITIGCCWCHILLSSYESCWALKWWMWRLFSLRINPKDMWSHDLPNPQDKWGCSQKNHSWTWSLIDVIVVGQGPLMHSAGVVYSWPLMFQLNSFLGQNHLLLIDYSDKYWFKQTTLALSQWLVVTHLFN